MKKQILATLLVAYALPALAATDEARLLRFPTTNGSEVVFTYGGDLYKAPIGGGEAVRLTSHVGYELFARFSPDGKTIAFTGEYDGNREVYTLPIDGGAPVRMTYTSTNARDDVGDRMGPNNIALTWTPDGEKIIYRNRIGDGFPGKLWSVSKNGGMPEQLPLPEGGFCSYSPDGKRLAYNRVFREFRTWKYYRGGMADDIWIYDESAKTVKNITNNPAQDIAPMWIGDDIYFISDRDMTMNLFVYHTTTGKTEKVTNYTDYDIKFPSSNGRLIVYEQGGYLYRFDPSTQKATRIPITLNGENSIARTERKAVADYLNAIDLTSDGKRIAVTARGEVFNVPAGKGVTYNITRTPGANDRCAAWSPDNRYIAYISDRTGETEVWLERAEGGEPIQLTKENDTYIRRLQWSPDSKSVLYTDRKNRIVVVDVASKSKQTIVQCPEREFRHVAYSPDSKWITYTRPAANEMQVVYLYNLAERKEYPVTEKWYNSSDPVFSADGKYLIFSSNRDFNPIYGELEWNHVYTKTGGIYLAMLSNDTPSPFLAEDEMATIGDDSSTKDSPKKEETATTLGAVDVRIDTEGILGRIVKLPLSADYYGDFYSDGKTVWYSDGKNNVHAYKLADQKEETVAENAVMVVAAGGKKALFRQKNNLYVMDLTAAKASLDKAVNLNDMTATIDYPQEWAQIFDEAWRAFRDGFYLENMHGVDWKAIKEKYAVLLPYVATRLDLNYVIGEMISELACGHAYVTPGEYKKPERIPMGLLGAEMSRDAKSGFYKIEKIIAGAPYSQSLRSPLTEPGLEVNEGDYITAVDGIPTSSVGNIYQLLVGKANVMTELEINHKAQKEGSRKVVIKPIADEHPLYHYNWVQNNLKRVEEATNGRVGYIYIPDMGPEGLKEFARYFYPQLDKEALIIDDRANGGGNISPMIIERLLRKPYRMTMSRTSSTVGTIPDATQYGPKVLLINKYSASDGDLFPWSFQANKIGTIIGTRTWGGIIGISGSLPYMDGTDIRVPFFTNYDATTGQWIVENHGVDPDILLDNDPIKEQAGEDQQLEKAIEVALQQLKERKPLPKTPAPRTFKDLGL